MLLLFAIENIVILAIIIMAGVGRGREGILSLSVTAVAVVVAAEQEVKSTSWWRRRRCATIGNRIGNGSSSV